jgi:NAD(P)-dependent dehydrogenase (short-subunit alcohol dehydrogenase family)
LSSLDRKTKRGIMKLGPNIAAIVTGGASGLGAATAAALAAARCKVAIFDMNRDAGEAFAAQSRIDGSLRMAPR